MEINTSYLTKPLTFISLAGYCISASALDAGQLLNEQQRTQPPNQPQLNEIERPAQELKFDDVQATDKIKIKTIRFQGAEHLNLDPQLSQWVAEAIGKELSFAQLQQLAEHVTRQLRNSGYLLSKAYLPKQDVTEGEIQINILQGQVDKDGLTIKGDGLRINELRLQDVLQQSVRAGQALRKDELERSLLLINDMPGLNAQASLGGGTAAGTSKVTVNIKEGSLLTGGVWSDNFGNRYAGTWRGNGLLNINDPLRIGDQLRLTMTGSEGTMLGSARYTVPLTANGLGMDLHYSNLQYHLLDGYFPGAKFAGEANTVGTGFSYPFIRSRQPSLWGSVGFDHRALRDNWSTGNLSDRQINEALVSLTANTLDSWFGGGISNGRIGMVAGDLDRSDNADDLYNDLQGPKTQGGFAKFTYILARLQKLNEQFSLYGALNGQQANGNLDSSEKFILGGPAGVRAYPIGEASGDHGWVINTELRWDLPYATPIGKLQMLSFIDTGHITLHDHAWANAINNLSGKNNYQLSGGGISINLTQYNRYQISGTWAAPIGGNPGRTGNDRSTAKDADENRFWLQAMLWF
ncbi:ShlB/FhaC/HecB family hemolysin secretion/activation protein [Methylomonas albis]|uniref:ShlB/FhaC/HecB family hemolysin secretion/activation protein n=1 Tax=Methylomonas albis TaxID=1854563 RepID=A0ABR9CXM4_9GAMM|nr:ShlB/FhaC/HecB family hemolysin secretion/activation protein [Methylomonas albis]MBD9354713.1 ShlB/FhaC/HecB family hemolysin secretion/activation protein [Methylomonas albis]